MRHRKTISLITMLTIFGTVAGISWAVVNAQWGQDQPLKHTMPEEIRDAVMAYIENTHSETAQFMANLCWSGGRQETKLLGAQTYIYSSQGWTVTVNYPVIANPTFKIAVTYSSTSEVSIPYSVNWQGTMENESINEASYVFAQ